MTALKHEASDGNMTLESSDHSRQKESLRWRRISGDSRVVNGQFGANPLLQLLL
jgi:hypothetical protein